MFGGPVLARLRRATRYLLSTAMQLPPDRGHISTEQRHDDTVEALDLLATEEVVRMVAHDQHKAVAAVEAAATAIGRLADRVADAMHAGGRLFYLGAGTSGRLGVLDASECPPTFGADPSQVIGIIAGGDAALRRSSEATEDDPNAAAEDLSQHDVGAADVVVGIAAGGTTPWVLGGLAAASDLGASTALITCAARSTPPGVEMVIVLDTGAELLAGSTRLKAGTATKVALNALTTAVFVRLGAVHGDLMVDVKATNDKLFDRAIRILQAYAPQMDRAEAAAWIRGADGHLKTAIVASCRGLSVDRARRVLAEHGDNLRRAMM